MQLKKQIQDLCKIAALRRMNPMPSMRRHVISSWGVTPNPVGVGNLKTGLPSTYRPVGPTCPSDCPYLGKSKGCYAQGGNVRMHQKRAGAELTRSLAGAALGIITAVQFRTAARLHVSGDFGLDGKVDLEYVQGLCVIASTVRKHFNTSDGVAFSYTHFAREQFEPSRLKLKAAGIEVMYSDVAEAGGAVVVGQHWEGLKEMRAQNPTVKFAPCPAQASKGKINCGSCNHGTPLCLVARERNIAVVFAAHGSGRKQAEEIAAQRMAEWARIDALINSMTDTSIEFTEEEEIAAGV